MVVTMVTPAPVEEAQFSLSIDQFPESLHDLLREIDDEGNGSLELDEITEVFTNYAEQKKAEKEGTIALSQLPKELRPTLKVFDVDGDGTVGAVELANAAQMYKDSKNLTKRLTKAVSILLFVMLALVGTIVGLTAHVIEQSKETRTDASGITTVKGTNTPAASGSVVQNHATNMLFDVDTDFLKGMAGTMTQFTTPDGVELGYTITGYSKDTTKVTLYTARGHSIVIGKDRSVEILDSAGASVSEFAAPGRHLLLFGTAGSFSTSTFDWASGR